MIAFDLNKNEDTRGLAVPRILVLLLFASALLTAGSTVPREADAVAQRMKAQQSTAAAETADAKPWKVLGVASCSAAACHNAPLGPTPKRSEYAHWISRDKHARAYAVLFEERSQRIQANRRAVAPAHEDALCLKCHVSPDFEIEKHNPRFDLADGVHCETCHGPAEGWLARHSRPGWSQMPQQAKIALGFRPMKDLHFRAKACTECHIGSPRMGADVNHDLIAAGHPRLYFELRSYHARYPKHWLPAEDRTRHPDYEARLWLIGQLVNASQSLKLLAWRADPVHKAPWPELAEFDCYACHQPLGAPSRRSTPSTPHRLGLPPPNTWHTSSLPLLFDFSKGTLNPDQWTELNQAFLDLAKDRDKIIHCAQELARGLDLLAEQAARQPADAALWHLLADRLIAQAASGRPSWDHAAQRYLALEAVCQALDDMGDRSPQTAAIRASLPQLRQLLTFAPGTESPAPDFNPDSITDVLKTLQQRLKR